MSDEKKEGSPMPGAAPCLNPHLHGSMSVGQRCVCGFEAPPGMPHDFVALIVTGNDAGSKDTISQCARCNLVRHDYEYDGGKRSPNYPMHHLRGMGVVDRGCTRGDMAEDRAALAALSSRKAYRDTASMDVAFDRIRRHANDQCKCGLKSDCLRAIAELSAPWASPFTRVAEEPKR